MRAPRHLEVVLKIARFSNYYKYLGRSVHFHQIKHVICLCQLH